MFTRSGRSRSMPSRYNDFELYMAFDAISFVEKVPENVKEIKNRKDEMLWEKAMHRELDSIKKNET